jgi:mono/diheme cytochrome c family protein
MRTFNFKPYPPVRPFAALCVAAAMLTAGTVLAQTTAANAPSADQLKDANWIAAGRDKFVHTCGYCHGQEGDAGKTRPFRERSDWDPQLIFDTITNGRQRGANVMPAWGGSIPEDEIWKIVAFIKSLEGKPRATQ